MERFRLLQRQWGSVLAEGSLADVQANEKVVEVYLGR